jgi:hypothetical protein
MKKPARRSRNATSVGYWYRSPSPAPAPARQALPQRELHTRQRIVRSQFGKFPASWE